METIYTDMKIRGSIYNPEGLEELKFLNVTPHTHTHIYIHLKVTSSLLLTFHA